MDLGVYASTLAEKLYVMDYKEALLTAKSALSFHLGDTQIFLQIIFEKGISIL